MRHTRREVLWHGLLGAGSLGLRSLATGLPAALFASSAAADPEAEAPAAEPAAPQLLVLSTSSAGDPVNANAPGTYEHAAIEHSADPRMAKTALRLGKTQTMAAAPWASLPQRVLDRTVFFHHSTQACSHPEHPHVLQLLGAADESAPSLYSRYLAERLQTLQQEPILVGATERIRCAGRDLPRMECGKLRETLTGAQSPLLDLGRLRDASLDALHRRLRESGTPAQRRYVDRHALSRQQTMALANRLLSDLTALKGEDASAQVIAAAALLRLQVTPVAVINIPFGGDNHFDYEFVTEAEQTVTGVAHIAQLWRKLQEYGLADRTSFAMLNVFGRTLRRHGRAGRDHFAGHSTAVLIGQPFAGGVIGGVQAQQDDFHATALCPRSGAPAADGQFGAVAAAQTLPSLGKTLGRGLGLPEELLARAIPTGQVVTAALT